MTQSGFNTGSKLDRKTLKKPDQFLAALSGFFNRFLKHRKGLLIGAGALVLLGAFSAFWSSRQETQGAAAGAALFDARRTWDRELKAVAGAEKGVESMLYSRFDVEEKLPQTVTKLKAVAEQYGRTGAAFEARMLLGDLYFNHGQAEKAVPWYAQAVDTAPAVFHRQLAFYSLGYAYENGDKHADAIQAYDKALGLGALDLKGDLLLAKARSHMALNESEKARNTYDQILSQLPDSNQAKTARLLKNEIR